MARRWIWVSAVVAVFALLGTIGILVLLNNINTRKAEARETVFRVADITEDTTDPEVWGKNFPLQYDSYKRTVDTVRTRYGGSEAIQRLDQDPRLRVLWNGYPFAVDFREDRGHAYMLVDQRETERVKQFKQPGACLNCHASVVTAFREAGVKAGIPKDDAHFMEAIFKGFEEINKMPYAEATQLVEHPVSCIDCHDPKTMSIRVTRPAFINGIRALAKSDDPVPHLPSLERWRQGDRKKEYDPNTDATRQEMRSMVCGQCHVEYHFAPPDKTLTFPWHNGLKVEQIEQHYKDVNWKDWTHKDSGADVLKAQHPEFEMWSQGIHARSGVACADCHMPYQRVGAVKVSNHHVRSPMLNVAQACQTCHNYPEEEIKARVETIQGRTKKLMDSAEDAVVDLIRAIQAAQAAGASDEALKKARELQRSAQWRTDYVNAENSLGFHAPQEAARILGEAIDFARQGQLEAVKAQQAAKPATQR
ncbi:MULTISPECIES: ammonia-forming cytochrome c nitrite reductase subunit c552 [Thermaceae]|uniref:nitrite reductase (cytochrome; ammonia-forming) n=1 Tax=Allomeiothermus silvanus (strain ATCC 700542 / DSM 9946 / NBRC 106475 / NCIMB 13440 / VI-R2) TaxID=526227 RepID=D7BH02_ALLS1|nr:MULTISPECIES: ammonia-forming cytochrome c nitrite reductase subunit c552 [Thermaceae]ADH63855.1 Nitrite reductase (cytochrome; ammonia-forming) [Allomeiothermus silvanus DSM 9946]